MHDAGRTDVRAIFDEVLRRADPAAAVARAWPGELDGAPGVLVLGVGKASLAMFAAAHERLGERLRGGVLCVGPGHEGPARALADARGGRVAVMACDHPIPTARNVAAAHAAAGLAGQASALCHAGEDVVLLLLISGGGSAHLTAPGPGVTLDELARLTDGLLRSGAPIQELNAVRKHAETLKGGRLAGLAAPARVVALVLSDVLGDPLDVIASGPAAPDPTTRQEALDVLRRRGLLGVAPGVEARLRDPACETPKPGDPVFGRVRHLVIAGNAPALMAAEGEARARGLVVREVRHAVEGEASRVGRELGERARALADRACVGDPPQVLLLGGETTVTVGAATGVGGRNQELALAAALAIEGAPGAICVGTLATDGVDGPTDAAGAVVSQATIPTARALGLDPERALREHDSHGFFRALEDRLARAGGTGGAGGVGGDAGTLLLRTGATGTNVNDVAVAVVRRSEVQSGAASGRIGHNDPGPRGPRGARPPRS